MIADKEGINTIITDTVNLTVAKLKIAGLMKDTRKTAYQKTEELLRNYQTFKKSDQPGATKIVKLIDTAIDELNDPDSELIELIYFEGKTREDVAEYFDCTVTTVSRKKNKMINKLKSRLFSDDVIYELFL